MWCPLQVKLVLPQHLTVEQCLSKMFKLYINIFYSGDGTMRKNPQIWKKWNPEIGINLHKYCFLIISIMWSSWSCDKHFCNSNSSRTQLRILVRAVEMLAVGGKVVYSTCSMNPVEDEAVVSQLLLRAQGNHISSELQWCLSFFIVVTELVDTWLC